MKIALVAPRHMSVTPGIARELVGILAGLDRGDTIVVRSPDGLVATSPFERMASTAATDLSLNVRLIKPTGLGRVDTYLRDWNLVMNADEVIAYFPKGSTPEGGTWHVVHAAMQKGVPCRAFMIDDEGRTELIGSEDGEEVPYAFA